MILIADSGSTRTEWYVLRKGHPGIQLETIGFNPYFTKPETIHDSIDKDLTPFFYPDKVEELYFYGAGVGLESNRDKIADILKDHFENADIEVMTDMLGAARAIFGNGSGIACILGTGSNACIFENGKITYQPPSLGYILGDEGGGVHLGKALLTAYIRRTLPEDLREKFLLKYKKDETTIVESIYRLPGPNAFIAGFTPFLTENIDHPFIGNIIEESFRAFFKSNLFPTDSNAEMQYGFAGSVAFHFKEFLIKTMMGLSLKPGPIIASPIEGLVHYHNKEEFPLLFQ
ncbi:MAG: hypothetical protein WCO63_07340 [Bacteroidota bacterium]